MNNKYKNIIAATCLGFSLIGCSTSTPVNTNIRQAIQRSQTQIWFSNEPNNQKAVFDINYSNLIVSSENDVGESANLFIKQYLSRELKTSTLNIIVDNSYKTTIVVKNLTLNQKDILQDKVNKLADLFRVYKLSSITAIESNGDLSQANLTQLPYMDAYFHMDRYYFSSYLYYNESNTLMQNLHVTIENKHFNYKNKYVDQFSIESDGITVKVINSNMDKGD